MTRRIKHVRHGWLVVRDHRAQVFYGRGALIAAIRWGWGW